MLLISTIVIYHLGFILASPVPVEIPNDLKGALIEIPNPYDFGYEFGDGLGMSQYRKEISDGNGLVKGSYGYMDADGMYRSVEYKADSDGYRAIVKSNEPGMANQNSADATFIVEPPPPSLTLAKVFSKDPTVVVEAS